MHWNLTGLIRVALYSMCHVETVNFGYATGFWTKVIAFRNKVFCGETAMLTGSLYPNYLYMKALWTRPSDKHGVYIGTGKEGLELWY